MTYSSPHSKQIDIKVYPITKETNGKVYQSLCCVIPKPFTDKLGIQSRDTIRFSLDRKCRKINLEKVKVE
jgi:hypothetical protein